MARRWCLAILNQVTQRIFARKNQIAIIDLQAAPTRNERFAESQVRLALGLTLFGCSEMLFEPSLPVLCLRRADHDPGRRRDKRRRRGLAWRFGKAFPEEDELVRFFERDH